MFRKSTQKQQPNFFDAQQLMSAKMSQQLQKSWAQTFREAALERIPEELCAVLFSEIDSRPNAPINIIVSGDMLKSGFGWTDEELGEHLNFDLLTRHTLGPDELSQEAPTQRTVYNLRRRVWKYAEKTGTNLYDRVFAHFTDNQITRLELKTGWQRMDSTQLLNNIARLNRLGLVIAVLQKGVRGLKKSQQQAWQKAEEQYLGKPPQNVCYRIKAADTESHLLRVGELLLGLWDELRDSNGDEQVIALVERTLAEQYEIKDSQVTFKSDNEITASSIQSPHDPEATYREKKKVLIFHCLDSVSTIAYASRHLTVLPKYCTVFNGTSRLRQVTSSDLGPSSFRTQVRDQASIHKIAHLNQKARPLLDGPIALQTSIDTSVP